MIFGSIKLFLLICVLGVASFAQTAAPQVEFAPGQKWSYETRPGEAKSYLVILKIDDSKYGKIVSVAVLGLRMKNRHSSSGIADKISHMPFLEAWLRKSVIKLLEKKVDLPAYEEGYNMWKEAFDQQSAGMYTISVSEAVGVAEKTLNN